MLENANNNILYSAISSLGPQSISKIVEEDGNKIKLVSSITDICHLCSNLLSNEGNYKLVIESLRKRSIEILAASRLTNLDLQDEIGSMPTSAFHHSSQPKG